MIKEYNKMKKLFYTIIAAIGLFSATSCDDMLDVESSRQLENPSLNQKTDSIFYAYGIMQAMQQLADQYFFQNELRGELVKPTSKATTHLQNLSNFTAGAENKYDSVYLYYKVINNCNYYLLHRDTTLVTGTHNVTYKEFAGVAAFRAWAYLQLTTQYGDVPYLTEPVTTISQINAATSKSAYKQILADQAEYLSKIKARFTPEELDAPVYSGQNVLIGIGHMNYSTGANKYYSPRRCFVPFNVVLGDLYLEIGEYEKAAQCYYDYLRHKSEFEGIEGISNRWSNLRLSRDSEVEFEWPLDYNASQNNTLNNSQASWDNSFSGNMINGEVLTYIPMAVNYTQGQTTNVPAAFGYDYYATKQNRITKYQLNSCPETENVQLAPSDEYLNAAYNAPYYYYTTTKDPEVTTRYFISSINVGDGRANMIVRGADEDKQDLIYVNKPSSGFFTLYRTSTVYLHLAEALNRLGEPELAFTVLKTGLHDGIKAYVDTAYVETNKIAPENYYIPKASYDRLKEGNFPFLSDANKVFFTNSANKEIVGVHFHGAGAVEDIRSPYTYKTVVEAQIEAIRAKYGVNAGAEYTKDEYINAVEDLLCDEYAMEFAFEGRRFSDLLRLARHKNESSVYGAGFGDTWLSNKLSSKAAGITTANCYLPFK